MKKERSEDEVKLMKIWVKVGDLIDEIYTVTAPTTTIAGLREEVKNTFRNTVGDTDAATLTVKLRPSGPDAKPLPPSSSAIC